MGIKAKEIKSVKQAQKASKRGSRDDRITRIGEDGLLIHFLHEVEDGTIQFNEHYVEKSGFVPCEENCEYCLDGNRSTTRFLMRALDRTENRVIALLIPKALMNKLSRRADKRGTILDSDYELTREGTGMDTEYDLDPVRGAKIKVDDYEEETPRQDELIDLLQQDLAEFKARVNAPRDDEDDDDDDDDYDDPPFETDRKSSRSGRTTKSTKTERSVGRRPSSDRKSAGGKSGVKRAIPRRK